MVKKKAKAKAEKKPTKESLERDKAFLRAMEESAKPERLVQACEEIGKKVAKRHLDAHAKALSDFLNPLDEEEFKRECYEAGVRLGIEHEKKMEKILLDVISEPDKRQESHRRLRVYISGPITKGSREDNYDQADEMNRHLIEAGFAPLNPMFSMFSRYAFEIKHSDWMEVDLAWIECADAVIRLPGESVGADMETSHAEKLGIPVFKNVEDLKSSMGSEALEAKASK